MANTSPNVSTAILGQGRDPIGDLYKVGAAADKKAAAEQKASAAAKKERDKQIDNYLDYDIEKTFEPLQNKQYQNTQAYRDIVVKAAANDVDINSLAFKTKMKGATDRLANDAQKGKALQEKITLAQTEFRGNDFLDNEYYQSQINSTYLNDDGTAREFDEWETRDIDNIITDVGGYNQVAAMSSLIDEYGEVEKFVDLRMTGSGKEIKRTGTINPSIWQTKTTPTGGIEYQLDANGEKIHNLATKEVQEWFRTKDPYMELYVKSELAKGNLEDNPENVEPILDAILKEGGIRPKDAQISSIATTKAPSDGDGGTGGNVQSAYDAIQTMVRTENADDFNALVSPNAKVTTTIVPPAQRSGPGKAGKTDRIINVTFPKIIKNILGNFEIQGVESKPVNISTEAGLREYAGILVESYNFGKLAKNKITQTEMLRQMKEGQSDTDPLKIL